MILCLRNAPHGTPRLGSKSRAAWSTAAIASALSSSDRQPGSTTKSSVLASPVVRGLGPTQMPLAPEAVYVGAGCRHRIRLLETLLRVSAIEDAADAFEMLVS